MRSDLQPLISEPREDLATEYKNWLDLTQEEHKATLAKSCIALANHGGGFLVIGFEEQANLLISIACPANIAEISQDTVNSVIRRYADPEFHCQLLTIAHPMTHVPHPIVAVPSDLSEPVISRRTCSGTIQQHRCYIRKPGPRSEAPQTAEEWRTLLRRCVQANREDMLSAIRAIVLGRTETEDTSPDSIREFEEFRTNSFERWRTVTHHLSPKSPERFPNGYYEVSVHPTHLTPACPPWAFFKSALSHATAYKINRLEPHSWK